MKGAGLRRLASAAQHTSLKKAKSLTVQAFKTQCRNTLGIVNVHKERKKVRYYSLRFSLLPSLDFEKRVGALLDFCEKAQVDDVMFFIAVEELHVGHITIEDAKKYTDVILRAKEFLKERKITTSLNPWCTLAHYDGGRKLKENQKFRNMVGADGVKAELVVCPLCEDWRKDYVELLSFYAETLEPSVLWFEDDLRLSNHMPVSNGCFCDEHMKLFNAAAGTSLTREAFIQAVLKDIDFTENDDNTEYREKLEALGKEKGPEHLHQMLQDWLYE